MPDRPDLAQLVLSKRVLVCVGSGGVGKTTTSAAIALKAAELGKKACVLTIDPAKRLANSMGLKALGNVETRIPPEKLASAGVETKNGGALWAMMLDVKRTWDDLVGKYAPDPATRDRILANAYYQQISSALAGSQEFMAMEKLYELAEEGKYDLVVLDTPPTRHALDFLDAPKKMIGFMDDSVLKLFLSPSLRAGKLGLGLLKTSGAWMFKVLERITGFHVLSDLSEFIASFGGMYGGFKERAGRVEALLKEERASFLLVTSPNKLTVDEAIYFHDRLIDHGLPFGGTVVNRVHLDPLALAGRGAKTEWKAMRKEPERIAAALGVKSSAELAARLASNLESFEALAEVDAGQIERLESEVGKKGVWRIVPAFELDVHDLSGLKRVGGHLFDS